MAHTRARAHADQIAALRREMATLRMMAEVRDRGGRLLGNLTDTGDIRIHTDPQKDVPPEDALALSQWLDRMCTPVGEEVNHE